MKPNVLIDYEFAVSSQDYVVRALLNLEGRAPSTTDRVPLNLSLVLDRSGSMGGGKLEAARDAAAGLVKRLHPEDVVSVVAYGSRVETVAMPATGGEQAGLSAMIQGIRTEGMTNLSGGWLQGRELIEGNLRQGGVNRVLLLTDGLANEGITDPGQLTELCRQAREQGITTSTIGFGAGYNEHLLQMMADAGGGSTYYIERTDQATGIFAEELEGLLSLSAQNVAVEVRPAGAAVLTTVHHSFPRSEVPGGLRLELGDLYAREPKRVLIEFAVPSAEPGVEIDIAEVLITADVLTEGGGVERQRVRLPIRASLTQAGVHNPEVRREMLLAETARVRQAALEDQALGDYASGERRLRDMAHRVRSDAPADDAELHEEVEDLERMANQYRRRSVSEQDRKYMNQRSYDSSRSKRTSMERYTRSRKPEGPMHDTLASSLPHPNSYRVPGTGVLAGEYPFTPFPREARLKLGAYLDAGVDFFVDLTEEGELMPYDAVLREEAGARGMTVAYVRLPIRDMDVCDRTQMRRILDTMDAARLAGRTVYVHCWGGAGRTGTVVGCHLVRQGMSGDAALQAVGQLFATLPPEKLRRHPEGSPQNSRQRGLVRHWTEEAA